jgi:hypothetical protein
VSGHAIDQRVLPEAGDEAGDEVRRHRWELVRRWYADHRAADGRTRPAAADGDWVLTVGPPTAAVRASGAGLERPADHLDDAAGLADWVRRHRPDSLFILGPRQLLRTDTLHAFAGLLGERRVRWGVAAGTDPAGLAFAVEKAAAPPVALEHAALVDMIAGRLLLDLSPATYEPAGVAAALDGQWSVLGISGHGDGAHLNLHQTVLCGLIGAAERTLDGRGVIDGCGAGTGCKKVRDPSLRVVRAADLRAELLLLLGCNGSTANGELYPSDNSLALGALDGYARAVLTSTGQIEVPPALMTLLAHLLAQRLRLGELAAELNDLAAALNIAHPYVLLGDPLHSVTLPTASDHPARSSVLTTPRAGKVVRVVPEPGPRSQVLAGATRVCVVGADAPAAPIHTVDEDAALGSYERLAGALSARSHDAETLERCLRSICRAQLGTEPGLAERLAALTAARDAVSARLWSLGALATTVRRSGRWDGRLPRFAAGLRDASARWDEAMAALIEHHLLAESAPLAAVGDRLYPALHALHSRVDRVRSGGCPRCGATVVGTLYRSLQVGVSDRSTLACHQCGPLSEHAVRTPDIAVLAEMPDHAGGTGCLTVTVDEWLTEGAGLLLCQVRDKSKPLAPPPLRTAVPCGTPAVTVEFAVPADAGSDLFSVRVVLVQDLSVSFARCLTALVPGTSGHAGPGR